MMIYLMQKEWGQMRTTIAIDDELFAKAQKFAGVTEKSAVVREALKAFVEREAARRLARMGGSQPDAKGPPRRRFK
jgi:Arc/MetJ family transcription regulator